MKRALYIAIAVIVVIILALVAFSLFTRKTSPPATTTGTTGTLPQTGDQTVANNGTGVVSPTSTTGTSPTGAVSTFGIVSTEDVADYFVSSSSNVTVVDTDGEIAQITNSQPSYLSSSQIQNLISASFSYNGEKILVNFGDPADPQSSVFDLATGAWSPLPTGMISPEWSPTDYRIAYLFTNKSGSESLTTLDASKPKAAPVTITTMDIEDLTIAWPSKNLIVFSDKPSVYAEGSAWYFNLQTDSLTPEVLDTFGLESIWSNSTSSTGLVFSSNGGGRGGQLALVDPATNSSQALSLETLPTKCVFNTQITASSTSNLLLYCAVPNDPGELANAILPDSYNQMAVFTTDDFYVIQPSTAQAQDIFSPNGSFDATDLKVFNDSLFFVNRYSGNLYGLLLASSTN